MEQKKYKQINTKTPEIQEMILSYQIGGVAYELSKRLKISPAMAHKIQAGALIVELGTGLAAIEEIES